MNDLIPPDKVAERRPLVAEEKATQVQLQANLEKTHTYEGDKLEA